MKIVNRIIFLSFITSFTLILFLNLFVDKFNSVSIYILIFNILFTVAYHLLLYKLLNFKNSFLVIIGFAFNLIFLIFLLFIYKSNNNWLFEFTGSDSYAYHYFSSKNINKSFYEYINHHLNLTKYGFEDLGNIIYITSIYKLFHDPIAVRFFNLIFSTINCYLLYHLSKNIFKIKYYSLITLSFSISSYNLYYISSGLKEIIFIFFILFTFYSFYNLKKNVKVKKILFYIFTIFSTLTVLLFRIPTFLFVLISITITQIKLKLSFILFLISVVFILSFAYSDLLSIGKYFFKLNQFSFIDVFFSPVSGIFGPFPTYLIQEKFYLNNIYAPSLFIKALLSFFFVCGLVSIYRNKFYKYYPILVFSIVNIISLTLILETFKIRYSIVYLPLFYIISGYGIEIFEKSKIKSKYLFFNLHFAFIFFIILFFNILRI